MNQQVVAIILAAGDSSRMGVPKALLEIGETTFLERIIACYVALSISPYVVLGTHSPEINEKIDLSPATVLINPDPSRGPLSSLLIGLKKNSHSDAFLLHPVDHPLVSKGTIETLVRQHKRLPHCILIPEFKGRRGHPVLIPSKFYGDLCKAPLAEGARWAVRANRAANHLVTVNDPAVLLNIDTKEDYRRLTGYPRLYRLLEGTSEQSFSSSKSD